MGLRRGTFLGKSVIFFKVLQVTLISSQVQVQPVASNYLAPILGTGSELSFPTLFLITLRYGLFNYIDRNRGSKICGLGKLQTPVFPRVQNISFAFFPKIYLKIHLSLHIFYPRSQIWVFEIILFLYWVYLFYICTYTYI